MAKWYFTKETEEAIIKYNSMPYGYEKSKFYEQNIHKAFRGIVKGLIYRYHFYERIDNMESAIDSAISHMVSVLEKFDATKGAAFSYFTHVANMYLILQSNSNAKDYKRFATNSFAENSNNDYFNIDDYDKYEEYERRNEAKVCAKKKVDDLIIFLEEIVETIRFKSKSRKVIHGILFILKNYETYSIGGDISHYNFKNLLIEITGECSVLVLKVIKQGIMQPYNKNNKLLKILNGTREREKEKERWE